MFSVPIASRQVRSSPTSIDGEMNTSIILTSVLTLTDKEELSLKTSHTEVTTE